jgi:hypothetical protein
MCLFEGSHFCLTSFVFLPVRYVSTISKLTASDRYLSDKIMTMCECVSVCARVHMQPGVVYVQRSELYASCVIWLTPLAMSVLLLIQMICQSSRVEPDPAVT